LVHRALVSTAISLLIHAVALYWLHENTPRPFFSQSVAPYSVQLSEIPLLLAAHHSDEHLDVGNSPTLKQTSEVVSEKGIEHLAASDPPSETTSAARPVWEWEVDLSEVVYNQAVEIDLTLKVSETGQIEDFRIEHASIDIATVNHMLKNLKKTQLIPATRNKQSVASTLTVRLTLNPAPLIPIQE
jgi:hypothetical protein